MSYPVNIKIDLEKNKVEQLFRKIKVKNMEEFVNKKLLDELERFEEDIIKQPTYDNFNVKNI